MSTPADLQSFLRFLSQDAKVPLARALGKVKALQAAGLGDARLIAAAKLADVVEVFNDPGEGEAAEKLAKQVHQAAKRSVKRKTADASATDSPPASRKRQRRVEADASPAEIEASLTLPEADATRDREAMEKTTIVTNRAPLVLAFAVSLLKYTMPEQPLSSRLSLAQAVVSMNSKSKAVSLGIDSGKTAEEEGWGKGQPGVRIMGREVKVLKRWGYDALATGGHASEQEQEQGHGVSKDDDLTTATSKTTTTAKEEEEEEKEEERGPALWGLDLEALKKSNTDRTKSSLPIHTAEAARSYLLKSFGSVATGKSTSPTTDKAKKERERNLGLLLGALDAVYESWAHLDRRELDRRAWSWYVKVRPEVDHGPSGWGSKGQVSLKCILDLSRP